jgi:hypothetical protein
MLKKIFLLFLLVYLGNLLAQELPVNFISPGQSISKTSDSTPASNSVERILINGATIWLGTGSGLSKSTDNGNSWTNYYNTQEFGEESISAIGYSNRTIWAATWHSINDGGQIDGEGTGLHYSLDEGTTWTSIAQPVDSATDTVLVYGANKIKVVPKKNEKGNFIYDMAFTKNTIWIATKVGGLRKSTDMGKTWMRIVLPPDNLDSITPSNQYNFIINPLINLSQQPFSILTENDDTIYVGTAGGINKSTDGGVSWIKFTYANQQKPITGNQAFVLKKNEFDNSIWAATFKTVNQTEYWGVSVSKDGGQSWDNYLSGEKVRDFGFKYFGNPGAYTGADVFAASENGLFRTSNNGVTWIAAPPIIDDATKTPLNTTKFLSVEVEKKNDGSSNIWIGSSGNGLIRLNEISGFWTGEWKVFLASEKLVSTSETYAFPNPFSPDAEKVRIKYSTTDAANVTIRIFDFGMNLIRTVIQNSPRRANSEQFDLWDGKDERGKIVPNGVYFYRIDLGSGTPLFGKIMVMM